MIAVYDILSLKYAIHLIVPVVLILVAGFLGGIFLCIAARVTTRSELPLVAATNTMVVVVTATLGVVLFLRWQNAGWWSAAISGWSVAFAFGAPIYARVIKQPDELPIGLLKGALVSFVLTSMVAAIGLLIWAAA